MQIQHFPGAVVRCSLRVARLPLTAVETIAGRNHDGAAWPPSLAFESFQAAAKRVAGSLLGDDKLVNEGRVGQAKVAQLRTAAELEAVAAQRSTDADREYEHRRQQDEERRSDIEHQAYQRGQAVARQQAERRRQVEAEAARKADGARKADQASKEAVARQDRAARKSQLDAEQGALSSKRRAVAAKSKVTEINKALDTTKADRKAGRG